MSRRITTETDEDGVTRVYLDNHGELDLLSTFSGDPQESAQAERLFTRGAQAMLDAIEESDG